MSTSMTMGLPGVTLTPGDHICAFYRGSAQRDDVLVPYLAEGLRAGDKCICVMDNPDVEQVVRPLAAGSDVELSLRTGQFELLSSKTTYLSGGYFAIDEMLEFWEQGVGGAVPATASGASGPSGR